MCLSAVRDMSEPARLATPLTRAMISVESEARFLAKVAGQSASGCSLWTAAKTSRGYGCFGVNGTIYLAHRVAFVLAGGDLDPALTIDHLCRTKACVNAAHLEQVPGAVNSRRYADTVTSCVHGHELAGDNLRISARGKRICRACARVASTTSARKCRRWLAPERKEYMRKIKRERYQNDAVFREAEKARARLLKPLSKCQPKGTP